MARLSFEMLAQNKLQEIYLKGLRQINGKTFIRNARTI
jgi:hypothetical protein